MQSPAAGLRFHPLARQQTEGTSDLMVRSKQKTPPSPDDVRDWEMLLAGKDDAMIPIRQRHEYKVSLFVNTRLRSLPVDSAQIVDAAFDALPRAAGFVRQLLVFLESPESLEKLRRDFVKAGLHASKKKEDPNQPSLKPINEADAQSPANRPALPLVQNRSEEADDSVNPDESDEEDCLKSDDLVTWLRRLPLTKPWRGGNSPPTNEHWRPLLEQVVHSKREEMSVRGYLFKIARFRIIDEKRRLKKRGFLLGDAINQIPAPQNHDPMEIEEKLRIFAECKAGLTDDEKSVIEMRWAGMKNAEIAIVMNRKQSEVEVIYSRAIKKLRTCATARMGGK